MASPILDFNNAQVSPVINNSISVQNITDYEKQWRPLIIWLDKSFTNKYSHGFINDQWGSLEKTYSKYPHCKLVSLMCGNSLEGLMAVETITASLEVKILNMESAPWNHPLFGNNRRYRNVGAVLFEHAKSFVTNRPGKIWLESNNDEFFGQKMGMNRIQNTQGGLDTYELSVP